jgi:hypothetical protein
MKPSKSLKSHRNFELEAVQSESQEFSGIASQTLDDLANDSATAFG